MTYYSSPAMLEPRKSKIVKQWQRYLFLGAGSVALITSQFPAMGDSANAAKDVLEQNVKVGQEIQIAMKQTWIDVLQGPLFISVCNIGAMLAGICLLIFFFIWFKGIASPDDKAVLAITVEKMLIVTMIFILIGAPTNRGKLLGTVVLQGHDVMVGMTDQLVGSLSSTIQGDIVQQAQKKSQLETEIPQKIEECFVINDQAKRDFCLQRVDDLMKGGLSDFSNQGWAQQTYERYHKVINEALSNDSQDKWDPIGDLGKTVNSATGAIGQGLVFQIIRSILISFGSGYLIALEHGMLLTGLVCPMFLGVALSSIGFDAIIAWFMCYGGMGAALTTYKIILGLVSLTILNSPPNDPLIMPLVLTFGSIFLSLILIGGGGVAIFGGLTRTAGAMRS
jgi:hypothetical protein